ncbi:MAG TPA: phosphoribosyltransferase family protein [Thermomicrobiales bacterium]|nr:phosphoribosyltransferase family protein [Thermomicrobiales bacterium]
MLLDHGAALDTTIVDRLWHTSLLSEGHFAYPSGRHSRLHVDRDRLLADPAIASRMGYVLAKRFFTDHLDTVAAPSIWGAGLAQWVAYFLDPKAKVVYATPSDGGLTIAADLEALIRDQRVLLVDNLIVTGDTITGFNGVVEALGGEIIGIGTIWNVGEAEVAGHPVFGLLNTLDGAYLSDQCPVCREGTKPVVEVPY